MIVSPDTNYNSYHTIMNILFKNTDFQLMNFFYTKDNEPLVFTSLSFKSALWGCGSFSTTGIAFFKYFGVPSDFPNYQI